MTTASSTAYLLVLSVPIKPGSVHRLVPTPEFELRLVEFSTVLDYLEEARVRGLKLGRGEIDARSLGLGRIFSEAVRRAFEKTETRPLTGLIMSQIIMAALEGYYEASGQRRSVEDSVRALVRSYLYSSPPEDTVAVVEGLEAVSDSQLLLLLDKEGYTKRRITLNGTPLGELFETLSKGDSGFYLNLRRLGMILEFSRKVSKAPNIVAGILTAYLEILASEGLVPRSLAEKPNFKILRELDSKLRGDNRYNRFLGATAAAATLSLMSAPLTLPTGQP